MRAQSPMGLYSLKSLPQTSEINPSRKAEKDFYITLPSPGFSLQMNPAFNDVVQRHNDQWIISFEENFNISQLKKATGSVANINTETGINIFGFGFKSNQHHFGMSFSVKNHFQMSLPANLVRIAEKGFPHNSFFDFSTLRIKQLAYKEISLSYSRQWNEFLSLGIHVKPVFGMVGALSRIDKLSLFTSRHIWEGQASGQLNVSAPLEIEKQKIAENPESITVNNDIGTQITDYLTSFKNPGLVIDLGATFDHWKNWSFSAAIIDLGFLRFKNDLYQMSFDGNYTYDGLEMEGFNRDILVESMEYEIDSITNSYNYQIEHPPFSIGVTPKMYLNASYRVNDKIKTGFLSRTTFQKTHWNQEFSLSANIRPSSYLELNLNYNFRLGGDSGPGAALVIGNFPLQLFIAGDYLPPSFAMVRFDDNEPFPMIHKQKDLSLRFGINILFNNPHQKQDADFWHKVHNPRRADYDRFECPEAYGIPEF